LKDPIPKNKPVCKPHTRSRDFTLQSKIIPVTAIAHTIPKRLHPQLDGKETIAIGV